MDSFIFIATSNQSGSSLLLNLFSKCQNVISFPPNRSNGSYVIDEGQFLTSLLPNLHRSGNGLLWTEHLDTLESEDNYNWPEIHKAWGQSWRHHLNYDNSDRIFLEKSPHNVARLKMMGEYFLDSWFICQVRNPYAVAEGVRRRTSCDMRRAGKHAILSLEIQKRNMEYGSNILSWRYEDLIPKAPIIEDMVNNCITGLDDFSLKNIVPCNSIDGYLEREVINLNDKQINNLSEKDIRILNEEFDKHSSTMNFFQYERLQ